MRLLPKISLLASVALLPLLCGAHAQTSDRDVVVVTGTRVENRSALDTAVAVDVVSSETLEKSGVSEVNQALSVALPSFNFPRPALADGTDTIRPASLRGLAPDQTLVLVNSKRRHSAALVNVNGTVGRGSSAVDLNTIPTGAISAVEVLRDGASAQYGSDAIAGVINIRLREADTGGAFGVSYGQRITSYEVPVGTPPAGLPITAGSTIEREIEDGESTTVSGWKGMKLGTDGFLTISGEYKTQDHTERSGFDVRQQYPRPTPTTFDPREASIERFNAWTGEPELDQYTLFANAGHDIGETAELYGWGSYQTRDAISAGFFRRALDDRNIIAIYPDGFLPLINPEVTDFAWATGARYQLGGWDMDTSFGYGSNRMEFTIRNTLNRSIGPASKTIFDAGAFEYGQFVLNHSLVRQFDIGVASPLNVAAGIEFRKEFYEIEAGEPDSFRNGGALLANGSATAAGAQVFPGFKPEDAINTNRDAIGAYLDLEANITEAFLVSAAIRAEDYSDFGETTTGKLSLRYDFTDAFALRASVQNGFRAPSLQQQFYRATATNFIGGVPFEITNFRATDPAAAALGAKPLDAEESVNLAAGAVLRLGGFNLTVDAYRIDVDNRIVLSENLGTGGVTDAASNAVRAFLAGQGIQGAAGRFFINGVNTQTEGVDIVGNYTLPELGIGRFDITAGVNFSNTEVTRVPATQQLAALSPSPPLFARVNVLTFEEGSPKDKYTLGIDWTGGPLSATLRAVRYGEVLVPNSNPALDVTLSPKTLLDLEGRWSINEIMTVAIGADNLLDEYPDAFQPAINSTGNTPFSTYSPFGYSGRFVYGKVNFNF